VDAALSPEFEKRWSQYARSVGDSWRCDETYIRVKGPWTYLYRTVDKVGQTVDFYLSERRDVDVNVRNISSAKRGRVLACHEWVLSMPTPHHIVRCRTEVRRQAAAACPRAVEQWWIDFFAKTLTRSKLPLVQDSPGVRFRL